MNGKVHTFVRNFSYTLTTNIISMLVSSLIVLILPKVIGMKEYGYYQLYLFYTSYITIFHFGWIDGIYLRYGGIKYRELEKRLFFSQFYMLTILQLIITVIIFVMGTLFILDTNKLFILKIGGLCLITLNMRSMLQFVLLATNRIKEYTRVILVDKVSFGCLAMVIAMIYTRCYKAILVADIFAKIITLLYAMYYCKDIVLRKISTFYFSFRETVENINVGSKIMFANIASMLIIDSIKFGVEYSWDISTFGKVSLTLNISNLIMVFINAAGIIIFPALRRTGEERLPDIYEAMRSLLMALLLGVLIIYYPFKAIILAWLPKYTDGLKYMALLFPIIISEGKMALLINPYLKALREENLMLRINIISLILSIVASFVTTHVLIKLDLAIISIVVLLAFRCVFAEMSLSRILCIPIYKNIALELTMTLMFILISWFLNSYYAVIIYISAYIVYLVIMRNSTANIIENIRSLMNA